MIMTWRARFAAGFNTVVQRPMIQIGRCKCFCSRLTPTMAADPTRLLLTGATGYIGGSVLSALLLSANPLIHQLSITAPVRREDQAKILETNGVNAVRIKDLDDVHHLRLLASQNDVVVHTASGFHLGSALALVEGLGERKKRTGKDVHLIHTSGTWNFAELPLTQDRVVSDKSHSLFESAVNLESRREFSQRTTVIRLVYAARDLGVKTYVLMPPDIYGRGTGLFNQHTSQLFDLVKSAVEDGLAEYIDDDSGDAVGAGHVHISDLARLYELLLGRILKSDELPTLERGLYSTEAGYHEWQGVAERIGHTLDQLNILQGKDVKTITLDEAATKWMDGDLEMARNCFGLKIKVQAELAPELGWKPERGDEDWWAWVDEVCRMVTEGKI